MLAAFAGLAARCQEPPASSGTATQKPGETSEKQAELPAQIELLETRVRFEANGDSRKEVHTRVHINNELGVRQFARLAFDYNRSFQQIEIPLVRVMHAGGGTADILPSAISDQPNPAVTNAPDYQDVRLKSVRILGLTRSDILEYRVITTTTHHPLAPDFWLDHTFDRSGVVSQEIFELDLPGHVNSTSTMGNWHGFPPLIVYVKVQHTSYQYDSDGGASGRSIYRWEIPSTQNLLAPVGDDGAPTPDVLVSSFPDWHKLAMRLAPHFSDWTEDDQLRARAKLHSLDAHERTPEKILRAAYDFVSEKLSTLDLPLGATGFRQRHVQEILDSGYASPEEKCALVAQFATIAGINAEIVLVSPPEVQKQFARPSVFTRVFVLLSEKKKRFALDPSLEVAPFGMIPSEFRGKNALSLTLGDAGDYTYAKWPPLPTELPFSATQRVDVDATLASDGALDARVHYSIRGENELLLRVAFHQSPRDKWKEVAQLLALSDGFRGKITSVSVSDPYATREPLSVEYGIRDAKFVDWSKKPVRIPALLPLVGLPELPVKAASGTANSAIDLGTPLDVETQLTLHLPPGTAARTPIGTSVERDYATFASKYGVSGSSVVTAVRHLSFLRRQVSADRAADYDAFVRAVQSDEAQEFLLERGSVATEPATPNIAGKKR